MKKLLLALLVSTNAFAISMPSAPSSPNGYDEIRTQDGTTCRSSVGGNLQIYSGIVQSDGDREYHNGNDYNRQDDAESAIYLGVAYSFGAGERLDCSSIAKIETERAKIELERIKAEVKAYERIRTLQQMEAHGNLPKLSRDGLE
ncbi:hypothetical protein [Vibrio renipiscarius]|uniref:Uncharacterized protein n=1 Tax=Vibrio renipiscarius TaxID=1461322 RepID=A0A0C2NGB1_9VIBR|nr:hypothetical protein [Vibrio renipiscarius]KII75400.1 hypothetical protein OJ16_19150 [Vibrio renipiscarius]KII78853.1 hypothetical protein PL18_11260 [Vibrio renipiscarius]